MTAELDRRESTGAIIPLVPSRTRSGRLRVAIIGSTGSVGRQAIDVVLAHPDVFEVVALAAGRSIDTLTAQITAVQPKLVALTGGDSGHDPGALARVLRARLAPSGPDVIVGGDALTAVATMDDVDIVLVATSGRGALPATLAALSAGRDVALANKESLVVAGPLVVGAVNRHGGHVYPVDSEHSALWQCLFGETMSSVRRLILTASGGPFRTWDAERISRVTVAEALRHPTWQMGPKITVDSATLMNKGLEAIEAHWMFGIPFSQVDVVVHPPSIVHSVVEFVDGSHKAQLGWPDMRLPIQLALSRGERLHREMDPSDPASRPFSLAGIASLPFEAPDYDRFPCLKLALVAGRTGGTSPAVLSAADEVAVEAFLGGALPYRDIPTVIEATLEALGTSPLTDLEQLLEVDARARHVAHEQIRRRT